VKKRQEKYFSDSRGALPPTGVRAEIIPVEPDQGNACAGKVATFNPLHYAGSPIFDFLAINGIK
jgi:hypothetical protein